MLQFEQIYIELKKTNNLRKVTLKNLQKQNNDLCDKLVNYNEQALIVSSAIIVLQVASRLSREIIAQKFSSNISEAIETVTDQPIRFGVEFNTRQQELQAFFTFNECPVIMDGFGLGVVDISAIMLRLLMLNMYKIEAPYIADEPTKHLSKRLYSEQIGRFLQEVAQGRQVIIATHSDEIAASADLLIKTRLDKGITKIEKERRDAERSDSK